LSSSIYSSCYGNSFYESGTAPLCWGVARIKLIYVVTVVKLLHKILSHSLETYLKANDVLDTSIQKGFVSGLPGVFEHIYSLSAIMQDLN